MPIYACWALMKVRSVIALITSITASVSDYNFSHRIERFSFGKRIPGLVMPLAGMEQISTESELSNVKVIVQIQLCCRNGFVPVLLEDRSDQGVSTGRSRAKTHHHLPVFRHSSSQISLRSHR
jgi:hypothetical protein